MSVPNSAAVSILAKAIVKSIVIGVVAGTFIIGSLHAGKHNARKESK